MPLGRGPRVPYLFALSATIDHALLNPDPSFAMNAPGHSPVGANDLDHD